MSEKRKTIRIAKKKVRVKSKKKVAPLSKAEGNWHVSKSTMGWQIDKPNHFVFWWEEEGKTELNEL